jgi:cellobiose phosphorylase
LARQDNEHFKVEPYVYCGNIAGPTHPQFGYGRNAWLSGTAAWMYVAATQWILGIRPTFHGLQVSPVIPVDWKGFTATRVFRGVTYQISVERKDTGNRVKLTVNGDDIEGTIIPFPKEAENTLNVNVILY